MENKFKFNASEVVCNGIMVGCDSLLNEDNKSTLTTFLKTHFMMAPQEVILQELQDSGVLDQDWIVGRRASDIDSIITRMISGLLEYALPNFDDSWELAGMWINAQIEMMSAKDIITVMESALMDCASADHWYKYEKQWD